MSSWLRSIRLAPTSPLATTSPSGGYAALTKEALRETVEPARDSVRLTESKRDILADMTVASVGVLFQQIRVAIGREKE